MQVRRTAWRIHVLNYGTLAGRADNVNLEVGTPGHRHLAAGLEIVAGRVTEESAVQGSHARLVGEIVRRQGSQRLNDLGLFPALREPVLGEANCRPRASLLCRLRISVASRSFGFSVQGSHT